MKHNIFSVVVISILTLVACKAQTINLDSEYNRVAGAYYKDVNYQLDKYVGTWLYTNGTTTLKIVLKKKINVHNSSANFYEDLLVGEYQYIQNGAVIINTLSRLSDNTISPRDYFISGNRLLKHYIKPICSECDEVFKRVAIHFEDPAATYFLYDAYIGFQEDLPANKLIFDLRKGTSSIPENATITATRIPEGHYILIKQP